ncbi:hypothetical protein J4458_03275 [Candidatus Woesearchaeota archaeon]|nr:hypothetical protein [Candidatus Woesearchaeota archaeon]
MMKGTNMEMTNQALADTYFGVESLYAKSTDTYRVIKRRIAESPVDIANFFAEHGSLAGLNTSGIGSKTKEALELILREGPEAAALKKHATARDEAMRSFKDIPKPPQIGEEDAFPQGPYERNETIRNRRD